MEPYESYNNGEFTPPRYEEYGNGFQSYEDLSGGFEAGNPVKATMHQLKTLMYEDVIARAFLFMVAALGITAFAAYTAPYFMLNWLIKLLRALLALWCGIVIVLVSNSVLKKNNVILAAILYTIYSYLTGATIELSSCLAYTGASVASVFLMTAGMFGVIAIYGLVTKRSVLSGIFVYDGPSGDHHCRSCEHADPAQQRRRVWDQHCGRSDLCGSDGL